jgi:hypothetical protein
MIADGMGWSGLTPRRTFRVCYCLPLLVTFVNCLQSAQINILYPGYIDRFSLHSLPFYNKRSLFIAFGCYLKTKSSIAEVRAPSPTCPICYWSYLCDGSKTFLNFRIIDCCQLHFFAFIRFQRDIPYPVLTNYNRTNSRYNDNVNQALMELHCSGWLMHNRGVQVNFSRDAPVYPAFNQAARAGGSGRRSRVLEEMQTCSVRTRAAVFLAASSFTTSHLSA